MGDPVWDISLLGCGACMATFYSGTTDNLGSMYVCVDSGEQSKPCLPACCLSATEPAVPRLCTYHASGANLLYIITYRLEAATDHWCIAMFVRPLLQSS